MIPSELIRSSVLRLGKNLLKLRTRNPYVLQDVQKKSLCSYSVAKKWRSTITTTSRKMDLCSLPARRTISDSSKGFGSVQNRSFGVTEGSQAKEYDERQQHQEDDGGDDRYTHFGYEKIREEDKVEKVYNVFEKVANSYDLMNDAMSVGAHRLWKHHFVNQLKLKPGMKILDMAGGTGDISFKMLDDITSFPQYKTDGHDTTKITVSDINKNMLDVGRKRASKLGIETEFEWVQADAEDLPFEDESLDMYTIAFGIRNTTRIDTVLEEAYRVLKFGGRFSCLEFSHVENPLLRGLYDTYSFQVIPVLGEVLASDWNSYQYLVESIRQFPKQEEFADMIYDAGFSNVMYENLTFGIVAIHDGFKI